MSADVHTAIIYRADHPQAAWLAEVSPEDDSPMSSAWRTEAAAKAWVRRILLERFGIDRKRLPWEKSEWGSLSLTWRTKGDWDDDSFLGWGLGL